MKNPSADQTLELIKNPTQTVSGIVCEDGDVYAWPERKADHDVLGVELQNILGHSTFGICFTAYLKENHWKIRIRSTICEFIEIHHVATMFSSMPATLRFKPESWASAVAAAEIKDYKQHAHPEPVSGEPLPYKYI